MSLATGNGNIFELTLLEHDPAKDQFSPEVLKEVMHMGLTTASIVFST
jgi:hypothetical protein